MPSAGRPSCASACCGHVWDGPSSTRGRSPPACKDGAIDDRSEQHLAANEAVFREVNEAIERGRWPGQQDEPAAFKCECSRRVCAAMVALTLREYESVRSGSRRFVMLPGHEDPAVETVIERMPDYVVVEKRDQAGRLADASDPRS
jgi:hypothetical protein